MPDGTPTWSSSPHATPWFTEVEGTWRVEPAQPRRGEFGVLRAAHVRLYIVDLGGGLPISHHFNAELGAEISTSQVQVTRVQEVAYTRASGGRLTTRLRREVTRCAHRVPTSAPASAQHVAAPAFAPSAAIAPAAGRPLG